MKKGKEEFNLKEEYKQSWKYIKETKNFTYSIVAVFILLAIIGYFIYPPEDIAQQILFILENILAETKNLSSLELMLYIFINNLKSSFLGMIFGVFLGIFPIITAIINGYFVGFVSSIGVQNQGGLILLRLLPHGIFELPAIFISLGMGLKFGSFIFKKDYKKSEFL